MIDDGVATGATTRAALRATRLRDPKQLVLAVPVAPTESLAELRHEADDMVCLESDMFGALGHNYRDFRQIADNEVTLSSEPKCNTPADLIIGTVDQDLRECCHAMLFAFVG